MGLFDNLKTEDDIEEQKEFDRNFDSGAYPVVIDLAYIGIAASEAMSINFIFKTKEGRTLRSTQWVSSGKAKGKKNYFENKAGNKIYLPGFVVANDICKLTLDKEVAKLETEEKVINLYNKDYGKEMPTKTQVIKELIGKDIVIGVIKQVVDKTAKAADGSYKPTGETRVENEVVKVFQADTFFVPVEIEGEADEPMTYNKWVETHTGVTKNMAKGAAEGGTPGTPSKPTKKLFGA